MISTLQSRARKGSCTPFASCPTNYSQKYFVLSGRHSGGTTAMRVPGVVHCDAYSWGQFAKGGEWWPKVQETFGQAFLCHCSALLALLFLPSLQDSRNGQDLEIMITGVKDNEKNPLQALHALLRSIEPLSASIASLFLRFDSPNDLDVLEDWSFPAHSVENLFITTVTHKKPGIVPAAFLRHFRNVSTLYLCDTTLAPDIILTPVKVLRIDSVFDSLSPKGLGKLCRQLPSLETFHINTSIEWSGWLSPGQGSAVQTSVEQLQICLGDLASAAIALRACIEVPQLQTLYCMSIGSTTNPGFVEEFICKLEPLRSLCCLGFLDGNNRTPKAQENSLNALGRLPYIEHIEFDGVNLRVFSRIATKLCAHMDTFQTSDPEASPFFPKLHKLSFIKLPTVPFREILRLVERRNAFASQYPEKCSKISEVTLKDSDWWSKEDYDRLQNLLGPGGSSGILVNPTE
jgi:hypothetical protein